MNIIFLGSPGVGKGTYTKRVMEKYGLVHVSTGDIFRAHVKDDTPLGKEVRDDLEKGRLVPDPIVIKVAKERLSEGDIKKNGVLLDGYPRTIPQAEALKEFFHIDLAVNFSAKDSVIIQRLSGRRICRKCGAIFHVTNIPSKVEGVCDKCNGELYQRDDDKPEAIKKRLKLYEDQTSPLIKYYEEMGLLKIIDANSGDIDSIVENLSKVLDEFK